MPVEHAIDGARCDFGCSSRSERQHGSTEVVGTVEEVGEAVVEDWELVVLDWVVVVVVASLVVVVVNFVLVAEPNLLESY